MKKINLISFVFFIFIISFLPALSTAQKKDVAQKNWKISVNGGLLIHRDNKIMIADYRDAPDYSLNHLEYTVSYFIHKYHEIGITVGKSDFTYATNKYLYGGRILIPIGNNLYDTIYLRSENEIREYNWLGIYYNFHYKDFFYAGIKSCVTDEHLIHYLLIGKNFELTTPFFIKAEINYSFLTNTFFNFKDAHSGKYTLSFGFGIEL